MHLMHYLIFTDTSYTHKWRDDATRKSREPLVTDTNLGLQVY